jgi:hypothetical protein
MIGLRLLLAVLAVCLSASVQGADEKHVKVVGNLVVHMGLLPAEMILGHRSATDMHGGVPPGGHVYHVLIAVFDTGTGRRVDDLQDVWATVVGQAERSDRRKLESMTFGGEVGYGNYFDFPDTGPYQVAVHLRRRGGPIQIVTFDVKHVRV